MIIELLESYLHRKEYERNIKNSEVTSIVTHLLSSTINNDSNLTKHPLHNKRLEEYKNSVSYWLPNNEVNINFGDSLSDMSRKQLYNCHTGIFSISGSWSHHIKQMAIDMREPLKKMKIKNISVGCLGGNPLLCYQNYDIVLKEAISCLDTIRELYYKSRIIVYGLPPVYNIHVIDNTWDFDFAIQQWTIEDKNAKFISLKENFGKGFAKLFPSINYSIDGIHFNSNGAIRFNGLIKLEQEL